MSVKLNAAPKPRGGDSIALAPLKGKVIAIMATDRYEVDTKFGARKLTAVKVLVEGSKEVLEGVLFQSYFTGLNLNEWFVGRVEKTERAWTLETTGIQPKTLAALSKVIDSLPTDDDVPF